MKNYLILLLFGVLAGNAQKFEPQKVTVGDLEQKMYPLDSSASAAILYKTGEVRFNYNMEKGFIMRSTVKVRIKIYGKDGYDNANATIDYYFGGSNESRERVQISNAVTYNLVDGKIEKTKLKTDGIFDVKVSKYWSQKKISMPAVKEGSIIEYEYSIESPNGFTMPDWAFQDEIPVAYSELKTYVPEFFVYSHNQRGSYILKVDTDVIHTSINYSVTTHSGVHAVQSKTEYESIPYSETRTIYSAKDLPAMRPEKYVNNIRNYSCTMSHELMMTKFPDSQVKTFSSDWSDVARIINKSEDFGGELEKSGYYENEVDALISQISSPAKKAMVLFDFVKSHVKWNGEFGYSCDEGVRKAFKDKSGNVAEINLMLVSMLRHAGLSANPVVLSTRSHVISLFPNLTTFNYVIAALDIDGSTVLLDATEKYSIPNVLPKRDLNWHGRLIRQDGTSDDIKMFPAKPSRETVIMMFAINGQGSVEGKYRRQLQDNLALEFRSENIGTNQERFLEEVENGNGKIEISDYKRENELELDKGITESYSFKKENGVEQIGGKLYVSPMLFLAGATNPFKMETREFPVDYAFPVSSKYNVSIDIPEGYAIETLPAPIAMATEGGFGTFRYSVASAGNKIQVFVSTEITEPLIPPGSYPVLKDFYQKMIDKQNEKIVLKKV